MNILFISTSYPKDIKDWQGRFIADMVDSLSRCDGIRLKTWMPEGNTPDNVKNAALPEETLWFENLRSKGGIARLLRNADAKSVSGILHLLKYLRAVYIREKNAADVIHVNWLQNALPLWGTDTPALITVLGTDYKLLKLPGMRTFLRTVLRRRKCIIAPNAGWMAPQLKIMFGDFAEIRAFPFGVHENWYEINRETPDPQSPKWLTVLRITPKKIGSLFEWGKKHLPQNHHLHLFGPNQGNVDIPQWLTYHGPTHPQALQNQWYPKAWGMITLSQHDEGRPQVILEAMAAGLPVIASDIPAHRDLIIHGETGWLVRTETDFKDGLSNLSQWDNNRQMGNAGKEWMIKNIGTWDDCAARYTAAYAGLLKNRKNRHLK